MAVFSGARGENSKNDTGLVSSRITWKFVLLQQLAKTGGDESLLISLFFKEMARLSSSKSPSGTLPSLTHYTYKNPFRHANFQVIVVHTGKLAHPRRPLSARFLDESWQLGLVCSFKGIVVYLCFVSLTQRLLRS